MNRLRATLFALLACLLLALPVAAQSPLDERINMDLKDADVRETLEAFGQILTSSSDAVTIGPGVGGKLTLTLNGVRIETLLTAVCESVGCTWNFDGERLWFARDPDALARISRGGGDSAALGDDPIDISLRDARLGDLLTSFARVAELPLEIAPQVDEDALVTVELTNVPFGQALSSVCEMSGCRWSVANSNGERVLKIDPL